MTAVINFMVLACASLRVRKRGSRPLALQGFSRGRRRASSKGLANRTPCEQRLLKPWLVRGFLFLVAACVQCAPRRAEYLLCRADARIECGALLTGGALRARCLPSDGRAGARSAITVGSRHIQRATLWCYATLSASAGASR